MDKLVLGTSEFEEERYSRQRDIVPPEKLLETKVTIVGTGAIGRQVAVQLAAMGIPNLQLIDFDTVEVGNLAAQGFLEEDLDKSKVEAVSQMCKKINSNIFIEEINGRYTRFLETNPIVFCCVDKIDIRKFIWDHIKENENLEMFIDGRMAAEAMRIITHSKGNDPDDYQKTLFEESEVYTGSCTAKTTIYGSNVIAGMMVGQLTKMMREIPLEKDFNFNLLTLELGIE